MTKSPPKEGCQRIWDLGSELLGLNSYDWSLGWFYESYQKLMKLIVTWDRILLVLGSIQKSFKDQLRFKYFS